MTNKEIAEKAEQYRREMMRMYNQSGVRNQDQNEAFVTPQQAEENAGEADENSVQENTVEEIERITDSGTDETESLQESEFEMAELRFSEPEISDFANDEAAESYSEDFRESNGAKGYIQIVTRAGFDAFPIKDALATISYSENGQLLFEKSVITDESGKTEKIEVPAPNVSYSLKPNETVRPYSLYNISVYADGYFRQRSINVPVFEGITSVQQFNLIPLPVYMDEGDSVTEIYNQEPEL